MSDVHENKKLSAEYLTCQRFLKKLEYLAVPMAFLISRPECTCISELQLHLGLGGYWGSLIWVGTLKTSPSGLRIHLRLGGCTAI